MIFSEDLTRAAHLLEDKSLTCALCRGEREYTSRQHGIKPLLSLLDDKTDVRGFAAADRVVGRGAAFLYLLLGISELYAQVLSRPAAEVLDGGGIRYRCDSLVPSIRNRAGDGMCPMEEATLPCRTPEEALAAIRRRLAELSR